MKRSVFLLLAVCAVTVMYRANVQASLLYEQFDLFFGAPTLNGGEVKGTFLFDTVNDTIGGTYAQQMTFISSNVPEWNATFSQQIATILYVVTAPPIPTLDIWNASYTQGMHLEFNAGSAPGIFNTPGIYAFNPALTDPFVPPTNWSYATINGVTAYPDPTLDVVWTVSAVPGPSSYILLLSGLGLISFWGMGKVSRPQ